ncbi:MAG: HPr family phosphocarrier protein [Clostridia bacterium]|nr:HPr family phosphocarrier protein [Clostridia bacterium]
MLRQPIAFPGGRPLTRSTAAQVAKVTTHFECRIMIEREQKLVNAKSMLGLLSLGLDDLNNMVLIAEGPDEQEAVNAIVSLLTEEMA